MSLHKHALCCSGQCEPQSEAQGALVLSPLEEHHSNSLLSTELHRRGLSHLLLVYYSQLFSFAVFLHAPF